MKRILNYLRYNPWIIILLAILALGAYLRLHDIAGYMTFLGDEGRDVLVVKQMIVDHKFTLLGPTASVGGFFMGPIYYYFMLPFLWAWNLDPVGPAIMVALFGIATIFLVYKVGNDFFNRTTGLMAAALYALSPVAIAYSRSSWNPNLVPFFSLLAIWLLWRIVTKNSWKETLWLGVVFGIGLQLHYVFLFLIPVAVLWLIIHGHEKKHLFPYALGIIGFLIGYSPFLLFEVRHGFPNTISIFRFLQGGKDTGFTFGHFIATVADVTFRIFGRLVFRLPQPEIWSSLVRWHLSSWIYGTWLAISVTTGFLLVVGWGSSKAKKSQLFLVREVSQKPAQLLILWFLVIILLFGLYKKGIYDYYFGIFFTMPFLYVGAFLSYLLRFKYTKFVAMIIFVGLVWLNWEGMPFKNSPNNQLAQVRKIARVAMDQTNGQPFNFALITATNSDHAYRYFFEIWGHKPVTIQNTTVDPDRKTVTNQLIVICEDPHCQPLGNSLWEIAGFGRAEIVGKWEVPFVTIYKLVHYKGEPS